MCVVAEDSDRQRVPAAVGDRLSDQRVVQNHPECHRQAGETQNIHKTHTVVVSMNHFSISGKIPSVCTKLMFATSFH